MNYHEEIDATVKYKEQYLQGLEHIINKRQQEAEILRDNYIKDVFEKQDTYREDLKKMLGWPLVDYTPDKLPEVVSEKLSQEDGYSIYRMQFEILDNLIMTGLLFKIDGDEKRSLVITQHGGLGTPERISGVYNDGTANYNDMLQRIIKYNVHAFAPQLVLWDEKYKVEQDRKTIDGRLKRVGSSITAIEVFGITRIIDYFETQEYVSNFGMVGLSYGGFYTLYTTAIDTRIKSAISCSFFSTRDAYGWSDWTWFKSAEKFDDAEISCLVYPRRLCIEIGKNDDLFDYKYGVEAFDKIKKICEKVGMDWIELIVFDGTHEFCKYDKPIENLVNHINEK